MTPFAADDLSEPPTGASSLVEAIAVARFGGAWPDGSVRRIRDLLLIDLGSALLVIACDSNASTGDKPADHLRQDPIVTGYSAAKVPLMEVLASGALPLVLVDNLCCELEPSGRRILAGIEQALSETAPRAFVTGSDEANMPTVQTGVGVTVIGAATAEQLMLGRSAPGDVVVCIGRPKDGVKVPYREGDPDVASVRDVAAVVRSGLAHEVLPVGSRGVGFESAELARTAGLSFANHPRTVVDLAGSAGASTCFLAAVTRDRVPELRDLLHLPVHEVGWLERAGA